MDAVMGEEEPLKIVDKRRFAPDGTPRSPEEPKAASVAAPDPGRRVDELTRAYQALEKDRDDFKKRLQRERDQLLEAERGEVALGLIETLDGLDLALASADGSPFAEGVRLVRKALLDRMQRYGVERVALTGSLFDPNVAEAVDVVPTADAAQDNVVMAEVQGAWRLRDRLVRPGRVRVARFTEPAS